MSMHQDGEVASNMSCRARCAGHFGAIHTLPQWFLLIFDASQNLRSELFMSQIKLLCNLLLALQVTFKPHMKDGGVGVLVSKSEK